MSDRKTQLAPGVAITLLFSLATTLAMIGGGFVYLALRGITP